jgi:hypothetical protein
MAPGSVMNDPRRRERHDHDDEHRLGVGDRVVDVVTRDLRPLVPDDRAEEHQGPEAEDHLHLADEVQELGRDARPPVGARGGCTVVVALLEAMGERGEPRGRERVQDREREDARGDRVEGIRLDACGQRRKEPAVDLRVVHQRRGETKVHGLRSILPA